MRSFSCYVFGYTLCVWNHAVQRYNDEVLFRRTMDELNAMMSQYQFPSNDRRRLREYFHQSQHLNRAAAYQRLTSRMSPKLQGEVAVGAPAFQLRTDRRT